MPKPDPGMVTRRGPRRNGKTRLRLFKPINAASSAAAFVLLSLPLLLRAGAR
ncbi:hypothetical protein ABQJ54_13615 [Rhodanobacter sp. Si-c]|uniref:Uncharacterized protein n=1 Tax=Rhodanobacter lycopersici TaxID=3162487 RepID=A0ABV3QG21_9GAMM